MSTGTLGQYLGTSTSPLPCACALCLGTSGADRQNAGTTPGVSTQDQTVIAQQISGEARIDVLLESNEQRWNRDLPLGSPVTVTYSFPTQPAGYLDDSDRNGWASIAGNEGWKDAIRKVLSLTSQYTNLSFTEVSDAGAGGQIRIAANDQGDSSGYAYLPDPAAGEKAGDMFFANTYVANADVSPGSFNWSLIIHELGHSLGLKHPGNYNAGEPPNPAPGNFLGKADDTPQNTLMTYVNAVQNQQRVDWGVYDLLALRYFYGTKVINGGDTRYTFTDADGARIRGIDDRSGNDTLDFSALSLGVAIDLSEGKAGNMGKAGDALGLGTLTIAVGASIENAIGSGFDDTLLGTAAANRLTAGAGTDTLAGLGGRDTLEGGDGNDSLDGGSDNDLIVGGAGTDRAVFSADASAYAFTRLSADTIQAVGPDGTDRLIDVETAVFGSGNPLTLADIATTASPVLSIAATGADRKEGNPDSSATLTFTVTRLGDTGPAVTVDWSVSSAAANGAKSDAAQADDFGVALLPGGSLSFAGGETTKTITLNVAGDTSLESQEIFTVSLANAAGASIWLGDATGRLRNDDVPVRASAPAYGKDATFLFDSAYYLWANPDLAATVSVADAAQNYLSSGAAEGRSPNSYFDAAYYKNRWADLKGQAFDDAVLFQHFNRFGVWEGRSPGPKFDAFDGNKYLADNVDVAGYVDANINDFLGSRTNGAIAHYIIYGALEQRLIFDTGGQPIVLDYLV